MQTPRRFARLLPLVCAALMMTGCVAGVDQPVEPGAATENPSPVPTGVSTESPSTEPAVEVTGLPIDIDCLELLPIEDLYAYNPNVGSSPDVVLSPLTERVLGYDGLGCGWSNQSSGERITAAVARFSATDLETIRASANAGSDAVDVPEFNGFYWRDTDVGTLQAFVGDYWIVIESPTFGDVSDALPLLASIEKSLS